MGWASAEYGYEISTRMYRYTCNRVPPYTFRCVGEGENTPLAGTVEKGLSGGWKQKGVRDESQVREATS